MEKKKEKGKKKINSTRSVTPLPSQCDGEPIWTPQGVEATRVISGVAGIIHRHLKSLVEAIKISREVVLASQRFSFTLHRQLCPFDVVSDTAIFSQASVCFIDLF